MVADMLALRRVPARFFGVFMSVNPVFAALTGLVVLGQTLGLADWLATAAIVTANAVSVSAGEQVRGSGQHLGRARTAIAADIRVPRAGQPAAERVISHDIV
jgi:inner membrane transporter RhtA